MAGSGAVQAYPNALWPFSTFPGVAVPGVNECCAYEVMGMSDAEKSEK